MWQPERVTELVHEPADVASEQDVPSRAQPTAAANPVGEDVGEAVVCGRVVAEPGRRRTRRPRDRAEARILVRIRKAA